MLEVMASLIKKRMESSNSSVLYPITQFHSWIYLYYFLLRSLTLAFKHAELEGDFTALLTGNRTLFPLALSWTASENTVYTNMLFDMFGNVVILIKTCKTDETQCLIKNVEKPGITDALCSWHMSHHCQGKETFISLVKSKPISRILQKEEQ